MNDIDHLRALRDDLPADPAGLSRARTRLVEHTTAGVRQPWRARARHGRRVAWTVAGAVAAAVAGAVVIGGLPVLDDTGTGAQPAAAAVFHQAARNATKATPITARGDQYVYIQDRGRQTTTVSYSSTTPSPGGQPDRFVQYQQDYLYEMWRRVDHSQPTLIRRTDGLRRQALRPGDEAELKRAGVDLNAPPTTFFSPDPSNPTEQPEPPLSPRDRANPFVNPTPETLATLPTDPDRLLDRVRRQAGDAGPTPDAEAMVVIRDLFLFADALIEPELRAALFRAAAKVPGMERVPGQVNLDGEVGIAIGRVENGLREEIIIDPETSRLIGERTVVVGRPAPPTDDPGPGADEPLPVGTVLHWTSTRSVIVGKTGQTMPVRR